MRKEDPTGLKNLVEGQRAANRKQQAAHWGMFKKLVSESHGGKKPTAKDALKNKLSKMGKSAGK